MKNFIYLVVGCFWASILCSCQTPGMAGVDPAKAAAYEKAKPMILDKLATPATAKFPEANDPKITYNYHAADPNSPVSAGSGYYQLSGYMDAQNTSGALIRSNWHCYFYDKEVTLPVFGTVKDLCAGSELRRS